MAVSSGYGPIVSGATVAEDLAHSYVEEFTAQARARAAAQVSEAERALASPAGRSDVLDKVESLPGEQRKSIEAWLTNGAQRFAVELRDYAERLASENEKQEASWLGTRTERNKTRLDLAEVTASRHVSGKLASILGLDNRWFWLCGFLAVAFLVFAAWHDRRHEYRRRLNGGKARAMKVSRLLHGLLLLLFLLTVVSFAAGDRIYNLLVAIGSGEETSPRAQLEHEIEELASSKKAAAQDAPTPRDEARDEIASDAWHSARVSTRRAAVESAIKSEVAKAMGKDLDELAELKTQLGALEAEVGYNSRVKGWTTAGIGLGLLGLVAGGGVALVRGVARRRKEIFDTCPMCLGVGTLEDELSATGGARYNQLGMVRCKNQIDQTHFAECDFTFVPNYRPMPKLCLPTLGHPSSGKTHWLAMLYRELNKGRYPEKVQFEKVRSQSSEAFDREVDSIINMRMGPQATQADSIPHPLVFNFQDRDDWGLSSLLVNIFDYSGEVLRMKTLADVQRRRALDADGYLFFLDPTQPPEGQIEILDGFREDVKLVRKVKSGQTIRSPVALCVSKIDLLVNGAYYGRGGTIDRFYKELSEIDPTGNEFSLDVMQARSDLVRRARDTIWPGWQLERKIDELFGGRYMYFPLTPVSLNENELGETDLSRRVIDPFGILEPLIWLLHMNGYPILEE